jgi:hypothetical protein
VRVEHGADAAGLRAARRLRRSAPAPIRNDADGTGLGRAVVQVAQRAQEKIAQRGRGGPAGLVLFLRIERFVDVERHAVQIEGGAHQVHALRHQRAARDAVVGGGQFPVAQRSNRQHQLRHLVVDERHALFTGGQDRWDAQPTWRLSINSAMRTTETGAAMSCRKRRQGAREQFVAHAGGDPAARSGRGLHRAAAGNGAFAGRTGAWAGPAWSEGGDGARSRGAS